MSFSSYFSGFGALFSDILWCHSGCLQDSLLNLLIGHRNDSISSKSKWEKWLHAEIREYSCHFDFCSIWQLLLHFYCSGDSNNPDVTRRVIDFGAASITRRVSMPAHGQHSFSQYLSPSVSRCWSLCCLHVPVGSLGIMPPTIRKIVIRASQNGHKLPQKNCNWKWIFIECASWKFCTV